MRPKTSYLFTYKSHNNHGRQFRGREVIDYHEDIIIILVKISTEVML